MDEFETDKTTSSRRILESLPSRSRTTSEQAAARSRLVRRLRLILPVIAFALLAAFIFNTSSNTVDQAFLEDFEQVAAATEDLQMANPRFSGVDDRGRPFEITASSMVQSPDERDFVQLDRPRAVQGDAESETVVTAKNGRYRSSDNILELSDEVTLEHEIASTTYVLTSPSAVITIEDEIVESSSGVEGLSTSGDALRADSMRAYRDEGRVVFEGNVSMRIFPNSGEEGIPANNKKNDVDGEGGPK